MSKTKRINISLSPEVKEKALKDSQKVLGFKNLSGYIKYLILNHKPQKS